jgi:hypothetical protein
MEALRTASYYRTVSYTRLAALSLKQGVTAHGGPTGPLQFDRLEAILGRQLANSHSISESNFESNSCCFTLTKHNFCALIRPWREDKRAKSVAAKTALVLRRIFVLRRRWCLVWRLLVLLQLLLLLRVSLL